MNCLIISTVASGGSTGAAVRRDALSALEHGWNVTIASGRGHPGIRLIRAGCKHIAIGSRPDAYIHYTLSRLFDAEGRGSVRATLAFIAKARRLKPDVIMLHNLHGHYLNLRLLTKWLMEEGERGTRIEWTIHDLWPVTGHCAFLPHTGCGRFAEAEGCRDCPMRRSYPQSLADNSRANFRRKRSQIAPLAPFVTIRAVSHWQAGLLKRSFLKEARIEVHHPDVDDAFTPLPEGAPKAGFVLAAAYPWHKYKGITDLTAIRAAIPKETDMVVVGLSKRQARQLKPQGIICVEPLRRPEEMAWYFQQAGVFINPSYAETYGLTTREALACRTPVAVYDVGGSTEGLDGHPSVRAVPCGKPVRLAQAALELLRQNHGTSSHAGAESHSQRNGECKENHIENH